jgi:multidrug resistance efflux pump
MISRVHVVEGQPILDGAALFVLRSEAIGERSSELRALEAETEGAREALDIAREKAESQRSAERDESERRQSAIESLDLNLKLHRREAALTEDVLQRFRRLSSEGLVSRTELIQHEREANDAELALREAETEGAEMQATLEKTQATASNVNSIGAKPSENS